ncbi:hypothetical protein COL922a_010647 [Colletotrichum nupharicola]|nr:hypothetical protein COL922a_010647 [Colletotrichum nupharicola]
MELSRPFTCTECSQTFTRNENLERHKRSSIPLKKMQILCYGKVKPCGKMDKKNFGD